MLIIRQIYVFFILLADYNLNEFTNLEVWGLEGSLLVLL